MNVEVKNYDVHYSFGTDWVTEYKFQCEKENLSIDEAIELLKKEGKDPCGSCSLKKENNFYILKTVMY